MNATDAKAISLLKGALSKISKKSQWTQAEYARNKIGDPVSPARVDAVCWCAVGAIYAENGRARGAALRIAIDQIAYNICGSPGEHYVIDYNDTHSHKSVIRLLAAVIARLESKP